MCSIHMNDTILMELLSLIFVLSQDFHAQLDCSTDVDVFGSSPFNIHAARFSLACGHALLLGGKCYTSDVGCTHGYV